MAQHGVAVADVHGEIEKVHSVLKEIRGAPGSPLEVRALPTVGEGPDTQVTQGRERALSAAPVFFLAPGGKGIHAQAFFTLGKGGALEAFLTKVLQDWEVSGYTTEAKGGVDGFSFRLLNDPEERSLRLLPSGMYLMQLGQKELQALEKLPPLISSKSWPKNGGFTHRST